jgi:hypothetical protein
MAIATILPEARTCFYDANGVPLVSGYVYFYTPNTSTPKNTWQDATQSTLNTNPVRLDSLGSALIYGFGQYRMVVKDVDLNTIYDALTQDIMGLLAVQTAPSNGTGYIGFLYPTAVGRTLYSKLIDYPFSVKDFGAVGDGATDDTTAIQNALNYLVSTGGVCYFPTGLYRITSALSVTFSGTSDLSLTRPSIRGDGSGQSRILWDGVSSPSTYMMTLQRTDSSDNAGLHALSIIEGIGFAPINSGKNYYVSGLYLSKWAFLDVRDVYCHRMEVGMYLDQVISSVFTKLVIANNDYGLQSVGAPSSATSDVYANNANTFVGCTVGGNNIGGFLSQDGTPVFIGGSIETNGQGGTAGTGYGAYIQNTSAGSPQACTFIGVYFEANGTTGNLGANASTADVWIKHDTTGDNRMYSFIDCEFIRLQNNYAPYSIFVDRSATTACNVGIDNCTFTNTSGYSASSSRPYVKLTDTSGSSTSIGISSLNNYFNQSLEVPGFATGATFYAGSTPSFVHPKSYSALAYRSTAQSIPDSTPTALIFEAASYNDCTMWSAGSPTRLTVPAGVTRVRLTGNSRLSSINVDDKLVRTFIYKNGAAGYVGIPYASVGTNAGTYAYPLNIASPIITVAAGDYFELMIEQNTGGAINTNTDVNYANWMSLEIIE